MSFILDALKKSELERQRQSVPGLVDSGVARPRPRLPVWAIALGLLLGVNLFVLLFVLSRSFLSSPHAPATVPPRAVAGFSPLAPPVYAPEIPVASPMPAAAPISAAPETARSMNSGDSVSNKVRRRDPLLNDEDYKATDDEVLPTINEVTLTGAQALPEMHLDVHVFSTKPAERFVYVNMRKYHEGATLQEGPTIERIRRDGVILSYQGLRFLLPRQ